MKTQDEIVLEAEGRMNQRTGRAGRLTRYLLVAMAILALGATPMPALARDVCLVLAGSDCDFSGEAGFFRLMRFRFPTNSRKASPVHGRNAGITAVYGTAVMDTGGETISLTASFTQDGVFGTVDITIDPANLGGAHHAYSSYGDTSLSGSCKVSLADCDHEPRP